MTNVAGTWLEYLVYLLIAGNVVALLLGVTIMMAPERVARWLGGAERPRSLRELTRPLDVPRDADRLLLRHPRALGAALLIAAAAIAIAGARLLPGLSASEGGTLLARFFGSTRTAPAAWETLWAALIVFLAFGALFAATVGVLLLARPAWLERVSAHANRWVSARRALRRVEPPHASYPVDKLLFRHPRLIGGAIAASALYVLVILLRG